jgi:hypothetical protein
VNAFRASITRYRIHAAALHKISSAQLLHTVR